MNDSRRSDGYEPRFDIDRAYGEQGELFVLRIIDALKNGTVEVKRDGVFGQTGNLYVEFEADKGRHGQFKPSGLSTTEADLWVFVFGDAPSCLVVSTELLRALVREKGIRTASETHGSCPTNGWLLPVRWVLQAIQALARAGAA